MAKQISTEAESNLKRQARRRLIGAVALVLAVVVFLPMVFDSEPTPTTANDIELRIPDKDTMPPLVPVAASAPVVAAPVVTPAASAVPAALPVELSAAASSVSAEPVVAQPAKAEVKPKVEIKPKAEAKPKVEAVAKSIPKSGWVVQVGAYSNADTAKQMSAKLSKEGFLVYTEKAGSMMRVRVGSYPTREAAEKIKLKLEKLGLHPNVINLE